jgi:hypothetical protein
MVSGHDPALGSVPVEGHPVLLAVAQDERSVGFPAHAKAVQLVELDRATGTGDQPEASAGLDGGELMRVAQQPYDRAGGRRIGEDLIEQE